MRLRPDVLIFVLLLLGAGYAVWTQVDARAPAPPIPPVGATVPDVVLKDIGDRERRLSTLVEGKKALVVYFWSIDCPCVDALEPRVKAVMARFEPLGVEFVAVDSHPDDVLEGIKDKMGRLRAPYRMLLDADQKGAWAIGGRRSTDFVVLDDRLRIRYRGSIDDDLRKPTTPHLAMALEALLDGRAPPVGENLGYGCPYPNFEGLCAFD